MSLDVGERVVVCPHLALGQLANGLQDVQLYLIAIRLPQGRLTKPGSPHLPAGEPSFLSQPSKNLKWELDREILESHSSADP